MREILVVTSEYTPPPAHTDSGGGEGESKGNPTGEKNAIFSFLGGKSQGAFE